MSNNFDNWCPEIYRSLFIDKFNDNFVRVAPCCQAATELEPADNFDFKTSSYLNRLRNEFDQGQKPLACNRCWKAEQHGHKSRRLSAIEFFQDTQPDHTVQLQCIDHSSTWACNLACIMCGPVNSSLWATQENLNKDDLIKLGRMFHKSNNILNTFDLAHIKKIHFNGGEPMLNNEQTDLLMRLDEQQVLHNVFISYNTNATVMPSKKIIDLWSKARLVKIFFSIDAVEEAFDYIRWPGKWTEVEDNMQKMKQQLPSNVMFGFNCTVGSYNVLEMHKVYDWFEKNIKHNREGDLSDFCWQLADNFDLSGLPKNIKYEAMKQLQGIEEFKGLVSLLQSTINHAENKTWLTTLEHLDSKRNTDWKKSLAISKFIKELTC